MAEVIRARHLMIEKFAQVQTDQTLGEAMATVREAQAVAGLPNAVMVVDEDGAFHGLLTAKLLIRVLVGKDRGEGELLNEELLARARERLKAKVGDSLVLDVPVVSPDDRLLTLIRRGVPTRLDFVPVVDDGRPVGLAPITEIFQAAAGIALTPEHEGIRFDR